MEQSPTPPTALVLEVLFDEDAAVQAAQSDPALFGELYAHYLEPVYRYMYARTNALDAEDLTQKVFLQAFRALPVYEQRGRPFSAWLFRIARNLLTDEERQRHATLSWTELPQSLVPHVEGDVEADVMRQETLCWLAELVAELPTDARELLALRFAARLRASEIAIIIGKSEKAVQKQIERLIRSLRAKYAESGEIS